MKFSFEEENSLVIEVKNLSKHYGEKKAVDNISFEVKDGEILGFLGPNGAGKTTAFNIITGVYKPTSGKCFLGDKDITGLPQKEIARAGVSRTFQNIRLFNNMSVIHNVMVSMSSRPEYKVNIFQSFFHTKHYFDNEKKMRDEAKELLKVFGLYGERKELASSLPYGKQRKLEIARALATNPKILLLDEPAAGMNPEETQELMDTIRLVRDKFDMTILLIEHDMKLVSGVCEEVTVLNFGQVLTSGKVEEALSNEEVIKAYLGDEDGDTGSK